MSEVQDKIHGTGLVIEQAKRREASGTTRRRLGLLGRLGLAVTVTAGTAGAVAVGWNEYEKSAFSKETMEQAQARGNIDGIDTAEYLVRTHIDGLDKDLKFRKGNSNANENIDLSHVIEINGMPWDGNSPFTVKNTPYVMGQSPAHGIGEDRWLMLKLKVRTLLGNLVETIGYVNNGEAVGEHVSRIGEGHIARPTTDNNGALIGILPSGKRIQAEKISLTKPYVPTPQQP